MIEKNLSRILKCSSLVFVLLISLFLAGSCKPPQQQEQEVASNGYTDTANLPLSDAPEAEQGGTAKPEIHDIIEYIGVEDAVKAEATSFKPFTTLSARVASFISQKDSLRSAGMDAFKEQEKIIYAAILDYKREMEAGNLTDNRAIALLHLTRRIGSGDSSFSKLPEAGGGSFFSDGNFFFVGGAPFIGRLVSYDSITNQEKVVRDSNGDPELHFQVGTENVDFLFKSIMHFKKPRIKVSFGGPLGTYDGPPDEVKGIGSIIHNFEENIPAFFLTEKGLVPAHLRYYGAPFTVQYSCYSNYARLVFACSTNIEANEILAVYIPYGNNNQTECSVNREGKWLWTADLNADGIADIACAIGITEDTLTEILWFANVNGEWKIIDYSYEPFCT
jgi:hypothetical protein